jgi:hypothetical protein
MMIAQHEQDCLHLDFQLQFETQFPKLLVHLLRQMFLQS